METRLDWAKAEPNALKAMYGFYKHLAHSGLDETLLTFVSLRASQINHCAYCIDMHWKDLRALGVSEQKLYMLTEWREWDEYTPRERAALEWTEAVTLLADTNVPDDVYRIAREQFSESEIVYLTLAVIAINGWNRLNVSFRRPAGDYKAGMVHKAVEQLA